MDRTNTKVTMELHRGEWVEAVPVPYPPTWVDYLGHWWRQWTGECRLTDIEPLTSIDKFEPACRVCKHRQYEFWRTNERN